MKVGSSIYSATLSMTHCAQCNIYSQISEYKIVIYNPLYTTYTSLGTGFSESTWVCFWAGISKIALLNILFAGELTSG